MDIELALVLNFRIIEELAIHPVSSWCLLRVCAQLLDDAIDGDELDLKGIADRSVVQHLLADGVVVTVDESRDNGHLLRVERFGALAEETTQLFVSANRDEPTILYGERLCLR